MLKYKSCPKCGHVRDQCAWWNGPRYRPPDTMGGSDYLEYECDQCGFSWPEPCLDVKARDEDAPPPDTGGTR